MNVRIYRNLTKSCWSVLAMEGEHKGKVIAHCKAVLLKDVKPVVSEAGRQRVLREKRKAVHAYLEGTLVCWWNPEYRYMGNWEAYQAPFRGGFDTSTTVRVTYNPYKGRHFTAYDKPGLGLVSAGEVLALGDGSVRAGFGAEFQPVDKLDQLSLLEDVA